MKYLFECNGITKPHEIPTASEQALTIAKLIADKEQKPVRFYPEGNLDKAIKVEPKAVDNSENNP